MGACALSIFSRLVRRIGREDNLPAGHGVGIAARDEVPRRGVSGLRRRFGGAVTLGFLVVHFSGWVNSGF